LEIKRDDFEILVYSDILGLESWDRTRIVETGKMGPAAKRSLAIRDALGEILIFIDDDAYPGIDFLDILDSDFVNLEISAVGGPAVTPRDDDFWQKVSGAVYLSALSGGVPERYAPVSGKRFVDDWPSVNLSIRKEDFARIEGFNSDFWPGEDTKLCLDIIDRLKKKILYDPGLVIFHHRRKGLSKHLKQVGGYGLHRGYFAKTYPKTSLRLKYFVPSFFLLFVVVGGILSFYSHLIAYLYLLCWIIYVLALVKASLDIYKQEKNPLVIANSIYYIFFTHLVYGFRFLQGLITIKLKSKLR
jgi:hypothetical protein